MFRFRMLRARMTRFARQGTLLQTVFLGALILPFGQYAQSTRPGMGATPYADVMGTGVTFRVWSPNATNVSVRGSFNGWGETPLHQEGVTGIWSTDVPGAAHNHQYKYFINNTHWWKDPRSRKVTLSGYDSPAANSIVYDPTAFNWMGDTRLPVHQADLVIYEMHVGTFYDPTPLSGGPAKFTNVVSKLDYLADMGVNAIELLPIAEFPTDYSWGYNPADPYAVENRGYGGPDGLKMLVREAHARGIHVLMDVVHNHYSPNDLELYGFDTGPANRFYLYTGPGICCTPWGDRPNYANEGVRSYIIDNFKMWVDEYHVDGFRWDAVGAMRHYDPGYVSIPEADTLIQYINATTLDAERPGVISIAEDDAFGMGFDGEWDRGFGDNLIAQVTKLNDADRDMNALWNGINGSGFFRVVYSETHDLVGNAGAQRLPVRIDSGDPDSYYARKRSQLAAAVVLTMPGTPMLFMGQEVLADEQFADGNPLDWSHATNYPGVVRFYRDMTRLRRNLEGVSLGLMGPNVTSHVVRNDFPWKLLAYHRWGAGADDQVMVVLNFTASNIPSYWIHTWPANGNWYVNLNSDRSNYGSDYGNQGSSVINVIGGSGEVAIGPYSVLVLSRNAHPNLDSDNDGLLNGWEETNFGDPLIAQAGEDSDQDGASNLEEQAAGTNPNSAESVLKILSGEITGGNLTLVWQGGMNTRQVVLKAASLGGDWTAVHTNDPPTAVTNSLIVPATLTESYFRIEAGQ